MQASYVLESQNVAKLREAGLQLTRAILVNERGTRGEGPRGKVAIEATDTVSAAVDGPYDQVLVPAWMQHTGHLHCSGPCNAAVCWLRTKSVQVKDK